MRSYWLIIIAGILFLSGLGISYQSFRPATPTTVADKISINVSNELAQIDKEASDMLLLLNEGSLPVSHPHKHSFFIYDSLSLVFWTDNSFVFPGWALAADFSLKHIKTAGGDFLVKKWPISKHRFLIGLLPLHREYAIQNNYLSPQWNRTIFPEGEIHIREADSPAGAEVLIDNVCLFKIDYQEDNIAVHARTRWSAILILSVAISLLIVFFYKQLRLLKHRYPDAGFVLLAVSLLGLRLIMIKFDFPGALIRFSLFDPKNFASSDLNPSLGDLLLNELALFILCYYLFRNYYRFRTIRLAYRNKIARTLLDVFSSLCVFFSLLYPFVVVQTIYNNSAIVFDISQSLQFDGLRLIALFCLLLAWSCAFLFSHVFIRLIVNGRALYKIILIVFCGAVLFAGINQLSRQLYWQAVLVACLYFALIYGFNLSRSLKKISYATFVYLFITILCFSLIGTVSIQYFSKKEKIESQFRFAANFLIDRDDFGEYLLNEIALKIAQDAFIRSRIGTPFLSKESVRQKVRQVFLPSYFNKYDVHILLFGSSGIPYGNRTPTTFSELIKAYNEMGAFKTEQGVYFVNSPSSDISQRYLVVVPAIKSNITTGYIVLELLLKKVIPENVYPELLVDNRFQQFYRTAYHSYAVFSTRGLIINSGDFNYDRFFKREWLGDPAIHLKGVRHEGYDHIAVEDENNRVAVVSSPATPWIYIMANFSFLLVLGLALLLLLILFQGLINYLRGNTLFFSARIQLFINLAFFIPLIIVSVTTLSLTSLSTLEQLTTEYLSKSRYFGAHVASMLDEYMQGKDESKIDFENQITDLAQLSNLDANVYDIQGKLMVSSQSMIFKNGLISEYISPEALNRIMIGENLFVMQEQVGKLNYYVSYAALKSAQTGQIIGILGIPFFQSLSSLEKIQITILSNILNVFAVFFIVLLALSYAGSQWLTFPLRFITRSLSRTSLTRINQPLAWKANDEIGLMVKEYNQMLYKLGESKAELEQTQRERAWREIAQQVAHEIKNPLTPMKLMLQQLDRSLHAGADTKEKTSKALISLLAQVETLDDIASSFSSFAKMPEPEIKRLELNTLLKRIVMLHSQSGSIGLRSLIGEAFVMADEQLLGRIFSNIILNAFQAARSSVPAHVEISLEKTEAMYRISFRDNGKGIDAKLSDRVFIPHFSTKKSGSGLGLAISKQGIDLMGGRIWFESVTGVGTVFFIELPLA